MENKPKVLILYNKLFHYRIPIFNLVAEEYDLTVAYCYDSEITPDVKFKTIKLTPYKIGPFTLQKENIFKLCQNFDVVVAYGELAWLKYSFLAWHPCRKFKVALWSIGVKASYTSHFDVPDRLKHVKNFVKKRADAYIFYSSYPIERHIKWGWNPKSLFVANNTVLVNPMAEKRYDNILFIGTLYREKGVEVLLESYLQAVQQCEDMPKLEIVGGGPGLEYVKNFVADNDLQDRVIVHGPIYEIEQKKEIWSRSIACISPMQAGLSVLESMGYGTAFITIKNAITGGEILNITNGETGVLLDSVQDLPHLLLDVAKNRDRFIRMCNNASDYYAKNRTVEIMAQGIKDAIAYLLTL